MCNIKTHFWTTFYFSEFNQFSTSASVITSLSAPSLFHHSQKIFQNGKLFLSLLSESFPFW